jgi:hypothetical protein
MAEPIAEAELTLYHLVMYLDSDTGMNRKLSRRLQHELETILTRREATAIDVWIESSGGDAHATYKLYLELRNRCSRLRAIVPDYAKSAATLLCIGMDEIFMAPAAELGPLDVQIEHPDREGVIISGLEAANSLDFITRTAFSSVLGGGATLVRYTELPRAVVLQDTLRFMAEFFKPIVSKFDPHLVSQANKQLQVAERYATIMLKQKSNPRMRPEAIKHLLKRLVQDYPAHEFIISRDEAKTLGLPVAKAEEHPRWEYMKEIYDAPREESFICIVGDAELQAMQNGGAGEEAQRDISVQRPVGTPPPEPNGAGDGTGEKVEELVRAKAS